MANIFAVVGYVGDATVETSRLAAELALKLRQTTEETGNLIVGELKLQRKIWRKTKEKELQKLGYTDPEIKQMLDDVEAEMAAI